MESNASPIDQAWRAKLHDHSVPPPSGAWQDLSAALAREIPVPVPASTRIGGRYVAAAVVGLALLGSGWLNRDAPFQGLAIASHAAIEGHTNPATAAASLLPAPQTQRSSPGMAQADATKAKRSEGLVAAIQTPEALTPSGPMAAGRIKQTADAASVLPAEPTADASAITFVDGFADPLADRYVDGIVDDTPELLDNSIAQSFTDPAASLLPAASPAQNWPADAAPQVVRQGLYGGISAGMQITALLSERNASADINLDPGTSLGHAYGFALGYRWNEHWSAEANLLLDARQGAVYASTMARQDEEVDVTKRVQLIYTQVPLTVRYGGLRTPILAGEKPRGGPATVIGLQYGLLRNSRLAIGEKSVSPTRTFARHDLALLLGADYDIAVGQYGFFSVGLRGSLGLLRTGMTELDGVNSDKRNAVVGLRVAYNNWLSF